MIWIELLPLLLFVVAFKLWDIYAATGVLMVSVLLVALLHRRKHGRWTPMQLLTITLVLVFGGATLVLHDAQFIKWKPTILAWILSLALLGAHWAGRNPLRHLLASGLNLPEAVWMRLNLAWSGFFALMGGLNLWVAARFPTETWVAFKLFGWLGLTLSFALLQALYIGWILRRSPSGG